MGRVLTGGLVPAVLFLFASASLSAQESLEDRFHISGYGNVHAMDHSGLPRLADVGSGTPSLKLDPNDLFTQLREFSLFMDFTLSNGVMASVELEAGNNGSSITANYAYVDIDISSVIDSWDDSELGTVGFRAGKILVPFLAYNESKPSFRQILMSQPFTAWQLAPVVPSPPDFEGLGWSDVGISVNWAYELGSLGLLDLKGAVINGLGSDSTVLDDDVIRLAAGPHVRPRDGLFQNEADGSRDINNNKAFVGKLTFKPSEFPFDADFDIGVSFYSGAWDRDSDQDLVMHGVHFNLWGDSWSLRGEWAKAKVDQVAGTDVVALAGLAGPGAINTSTGDYEMSSWYVEAVIIPLRWGEDDERFLRLVGRLDDVDTNDRAVFTPFDRERLTGGLEIQFLPNARLRYEFQRHELDDFDMAPGPFLASGGEEHVTMHMVSLIFWF